MIVVASDAPSLAECRSRTRAYASGAIHKRTLEQLFRRTDANPNRSATSVVQITEETFDVARVLQEDVAVGAAAAGEVHAYISAIQARTRASACHPSSAF